MSDDVVRGWLLEDERQFLRRLAVNKRVLELGSYEGMSTLSMAQTATKVTAVDTFDGRATPEPKNTLDIFMRNCDRAGLLPKLRVLIGTTEEMLPMLATEGEKYDLIFIDCDHSYEAVKRDIELSAPLLEDKGLMAFHDYDQGHPGVVKAVDELVESGAHPVGQENSLVALSLDGPREIKEPVIYTVMPHRDGWVHIAAAEAFHFATLRKSTRIMENFGTSVLTCCFNHLYCGALNARQTDGVTHFAMLHNDVCPKRGWLDILMDEMTATGCDIIGAVVPLKNERGLTSTGMGTESRWNVRRLTMKEVFDLPETFTAQDVPYRIGEYPLLLNTGCWLMRLDMPGAEALYFRQQDEIMWAVADNRFVPQSATEDWDFSRQIYSRGGKIAATRKVELYHGQEQYHNKSVWGEWQTDEAYHHTEKIVADYLAKREKDVPDSQPAVPSPELL